jgi:hypothetical protein
MPSSSKGSNKKFIQRSKEERTKLIIQWENSHQSVSSFCKERGISNSLFYYWLKRQGDNPSSNERIKTGNDFIGLEIMPSSVPPASGSSVFAELLLSNGSRITFFKEVPASFMLSLVSNSCHAGLK